MRLEGSVLSVRGERKSTHDESKANCLWRESFQGAFASSFTLPEWADPESISGDYWNGLLRIEVKKKAWAQPKRIQITSGSSSAHSNAA